MSLNYVDVVNWGTNVEGQCARVYLTDPVLSMICQTHRSWHLKWCLPISVSSSRWFLKIFLEFVSNNLIFNIIYCPWTMSPSKLHNQ